MTDEKSVKAVDSNDELRKAELELKQLEIREKKASLQDIEERLAERELKRQDKRNRVYINGQTLAQNKKQEENYQNRCNHRKGGNGAEGVVGGQGDDPQFAVMKHRMHNNDVWVRCLRCAKTWKPPVESDFFFNEKGQIDPKGKFNKEAFEKAVFEYHQAVAFPTRNATSGGVVFQFSDGGKYFREVMRPTNLR